MVFLNIYLFQFCNGENLEKKSKILGNYLHYKNTSFQEVPKKIWWKKLQNLSENIIGETQIKG